MSVINEDYFYHAFRVDDKNKHSIEKYFLGGAKVPKRYLRRPHYIITNADSPTGIDEDALGFIPYVFIDEEIFKARFEQVVRETSIANTHYLYKLKRLN